MGWDVALAALRPATDRRRGGRSGRRRPVRRRPGNLRRPDPRPPGRRRPAARPVRPSNSRRRPRRVRRCGPSGSGQQDADQNCPWADSRAAGSPSNRGQHRSGTSAPRRSPPCKGPRARRSGSGELLPQMTTCRAPSSSREDRLGGRAPNWASAADARRRHAATTADAVAAGVVFGSHRRPFEVALDARCGWRRKIAARPRLPRSTVAGSGPARLPRPLHQESPRRRRRVWPQPTSPRGRAAESASSRGPRAASLAVPREPCKL